MKISLFMLAVLTAASASLDEPGSLLPSNHVKRDATGVEAQYLSKMMTCVRNRFGASTPHMVRQERCAYRHFKRKLETRDEVSCKSCDRFFYCQASAEAKTDCGPHHHVKATLGTVADCPEIRGTPGSDNDESPSEAVEVGWSSGGCDRVYLCSTGCRFASNNKTCSLTCR